MTLESRFLTIAQQHPDLPAIVSADAQWNYRQVLQASSACATHLRTLQAQTGAKTIAILATRSASLPIAVLACLRAGLPFAILDAAYPDPHIQRMLDALPQPLLLRLNTPQADLGDRMPDTPGPTATLGAADWAAMGQGLWPSQTVPNTEPEVAYYLFTSGSTGIPKCIETPGAPLAHFLQWYGQAFPSPPGTRYAMLSGLGHDPIFRDILAPLTTGGVLCIPEQDMLRQARALCDWLRSQQIERLHTTPPMLQVLIAGNDDQQPLHALRHVFSGGDALRAEQAQSFRKIAPEAQLVNFYGTSETPQAVAWHTLPPEVSDPIPVGQGIDGVDLLVLDEDLQVLPRGSSGQIAVRSAYLSKGYRGQTDASRRQYVRLPPDDGRTTYLTGDLGYANPDGDVVLTGRADDQINLHGHRIELEAIRAALRQCPQVADALVLAIEPTPGEKKLCAYIVGRPPQGEHSLDEAHLRQALASTLPMYMVPSQWEWFDALPLLPNGKVDRQQLATRTRERWQAQRSAADTTDPLCLGMQAILGVPVTAHDSFVSLGGDSLSFIQVSILIENQLGHLPADWETWPVHALLRLRDTVTSRPANTRLPFWTYVESTLLMRVLSIILVTLSHAGDNAVVLMATSTLFVVSGMSFQRFLRPALQDHGRLGPTLHFIAKFAILAALWQIWRSLYLHRFWIPDLLLLGTFFQKPGDGHFTFWYLDVLAFNVLLLALLEKARHAWSNVQRRTQRFDTFQQDLCLLGLGLGLAFVQVHFDIWNGTVGLQSVAPFKWLWMLVLGLLTMQARTVPRKAGITLMLVGIGLARWCSFGQLGAMFEHQVTDFFLLTVLLLVWVDRVPVPRLLRPALVAIGTATLCIYIVNHAVIHLLMPMLRLPSWLWLQMALALGAGLLTQRFVEWASRALVPASGAKDQSA